MPSRSMLALFTAIGGQLWDNDQTRLAKAILSANAVLFQSQPCDACFRCSMKFTSTYTIPVGQFDTGLIAFDGSARNPSPRTTRTCGGPGLRSRGRRPRPCSASASVFLAYSAAAVANALCFETEQLEEVGRIDEDLPRFAKACLAAEFAPHGCGLGKVAGGDVMPNLVPLGWRQYPSTRACSFVRNDRATRTDPRRPDASARRGGRSRRCRWRRGLPSSGSACLGSRGDGSTGCTRPRRHAPASASWPRRNRGDRDRLRKGARQDWRRRARALVVKGRCRDSDGLGFPAARPSSNWRRRRRCRGS